MLWPVVLAWSGIATFSFPEAALVLVSTKNLDRWPRPVFLSMIREFVSYSANQVCQIWLWTCAQSVNRGFPLLDLPRGLDSRCWRKRGRPLGRRLTTFRKDVERFNFLVMKSSFRFPNGKIIAFPATSFINDFLDNCRRLRRSLYGGRDVMHRVFWKITLTSTKEWKGSTQDFRRFVIWLLWGPIWGNGTITSI